MANISVTLYDGSFDVSFDCDGVLTCKYCLCDLMPPQSENDHCAYNKWGSCYNVSVNIAAMESVRRRLSQRITRLKSDDDDK